MTQSQVSPKALVCVITFENFFSKLMSIEIFLCFSFWWNTAHNFMLSFCYLYYNSMLEIRLHVRKTDETVHLMLRASQTKLLCLLILAFSANCWQEWDYLTTWSSLGRSSQEYITRTTVWNQQWNANPSNYEGKNVPPRARRYL